MNTIRTIDVSVFADRRALVEVKNYPVAENGITFLFGESGIGKSVISKALYGYLATPDLHITVNNRTYAEHLSDPWTKSVRKNSFFVFQEPSSHLNPLMKIRDQLDEGSLRGIDDREILSRLWQSSSDNTLRSILDLFPKAYRPSGGEKQRVLLAMAFKRIEAWISGAHDDSTMFVFDEPTGSLDNNYRNLFLRLLFERFARRPFTATIITHDYSIISEIYQHYQQFTPYVHFNELSRTAENHTDVKVNTFSPEEYLSWLDAPRRHDFPADQARPVLEISPRFSIFGRELTIFSDSNRASAAPLVINRGEMVYLKAPSGIGKTTLAKIIMGIYHPDQFAMRIDGLSVTNKTRHSFWQKSLWGKRTGMVFQHADESLNLSSTVRETFKGLPLRHAMTADRLDNHLSELFDRKHIPSLVNRKVAYLSGGQKQRLNLLRTLVLETDLIVLDEPLNGLDFTSVKKVLSLLDEKRAKGSALLMISHNEEIFEHFIDEKNIYYLGCTG